MCTRLQLPDVKKLRDNLDVTYDELAFSAVQKVGVLWCRTGSQSRNAYWSWLLLSHIVLLRVND